MLAKVSSRLRPTLLLAFRVATVLSTHAKQWPVLKTPMSLGMLAQLLHVVFRQTMPTVVGKQA
jgi:hypothetical protein